MGLEERLKPNLDTLSIAVQEAVSVGVLDGAEVVLIARSEAAARPFSYAPRIGSRLPALLSSSGRVLLVSQDEVDFDAILIGNEAQAANRSKPLERSSMLKALGDVQAQGYAVNVEETIEGLLSLSVPLYGRHGQVRAALNISSHISRMTPNQMVETILPQMRNTAAKLSLLLN